MANAWPRGASGSLRWQLYTHFSPQRDQSLTMSLLSRVKHLYRYVYDTHIYCLIQGINNLFLFFLFFFPRLFLPHTSSGVQFTMQLHKQLCWCHRRAVTR